MDLSQKNGVLPTTTLFFWKFRFSLRTSYKELSWYTKHPNVHTQNFQTRWSFIWDCFFPLSILKPLIFLRKFNLIESNYRTLNLILSAKLFLSLCIFLWLNPWARGEHLIKPAFMGISHTSLPCLPSRWVSLCVSCALMFWLNGSFVDAFLCMVSMVLVPLEVGAILGNGYEIQGQNYVALLLGSEMSAGWRIWICF